MKLTPEQQDALLEICNIGSSQAAKQLSVLLSDEVEISIPKVEVIPLEGLAEKMQIAETDPISCVYQNVSGGVDGRAIMLFHNEASRLLVNALIGCIKPVGNIDMRDYEHEAMVEIGNIIISACLSSIADVLSNKLSFNVPNFVESTYKQLMEDTYGKHMDSGEKHFTLLMNTKMHAVERDVDGTLLIMFTLASFEMLLKEVDKLISNLGVTRSA